MTFLLDHDVPDDVGYWSRRITEADRIVYKVEGDSVYIAQLRYHY